MKLRTILKLMGLVNERPPVLSPYMTSTGYLSNKLIAEKPELHEMGHFNGECPDCGNKSWYEGPAGGMSVNIKCAQCGLWLNHTPALGLAERLARSKDT